MITILGDFRPPTSSDLRHVITILRYFRAAAPSNFCHVLSVFRNFASAFASCIRVTFGIAVPAATA